MILNKNEFSLILLRQKKMEVEICKNLSDYYMVENVYENSSDLDLLSKGMRSYSYMPLIKDGVYYKVEKVCESSSDLAPKGIRSYNYIPLMKDGNYYIEFIKIVALGEDLTGNFENFSLIVCDKKLNKYELSYSKLNKVFVAKYGRDAFNALPKSDISLDKYPLYRSVIIENIRYINRNKLVILDSVIVESEDLITLVVCDKMTNKNYKIVPVSNKKLIEVKTASKLVHYLDLGNGEFEYQCYLSLIEPKDKNALFLSYYKDGLKDVYYKTEGNHCIHVKTLLRLIDDSTFRKLCNKDRLKKMNKEDIISADLSENYCNISGEVFYTKDVKKYLAPKQIMKKPEKKKVAVIQEVKVQKQPEKQKISVCILDKKDIYEDCIYLQCSLKCNVSLHMHCYNKMRREGNLNDRCLTPDCKGIITVVKLDEKVIKEVSVEKAKNVEQKLAEEKTKTKKNAPLVFPQVLKCIDERPKFVEVSDKDLKVIRYSEDLPKRKPSKLPERKPVDISKTFWDESIEGEEYGEICYIASYGLLVAENDSKTLSFEIPDIKIELGQRVSFYRAEDNKTCVVFQ